MDNGRYIWCRNCGAIHHVTAFDRYPIYALAGGETQALPANDWRDFMARHAGHRLEAMTATGNDYLPSGSAFDPMGIAYLEVSNGAETLLLRRSRKRIDEALNYEIVNGRLVQTEMSLEVQEEAIKEMKLHFCWSPAEPLADEKINYLFPCLGRLSTTSIPLPRTQANAPTSNETSATVSSTRLWSKL